MRKKVSFSRASLTCLPPSHSPFLVLSEALLSKTVRIHVKTMAKNKGCVECFASHMVPDTCLHMGIKFPLLPPNHHKLSVNLSRRVTDLVGSVPANVSVIGGQLTLSTGTSHKITHKRPFLNYLRPLFQSESRCSSFHMQINFHSHAN